MAEIDWTYGNDYTGYDDAAAAAADPFTPLRINRLRFNGAILYDAPSMYKSFLRAFVSEATGEAWNKSHAWKIWCLDNYDSVIADYRQLHKTIAKGKTEPVSGKYVPVFSQGNVALFSHVIDRTEQRGCVKHGSVVLRQQREALVNDDGGGWDDAYCYSKFEALKENAVKTMFKDLPKLKLKWLDRMDRVRLGYLDQERLEKTRLKIWRMKRKALAKREMEEDLKRDLGEHLVEHSLHDLGGRRADEGDVDDEVVRTHYLEMEFTREELTVTDENVTATLPTPPMTTHSTQQQPTQPSPTPLTDAGDEDWIQEGLIFDRIFEEPGTFQPQAEVDEKEEEEQEKEEQEEEEQQKEAEHLDDDNNPTSSSSICPSRIAASLIFSPPSFSNAWSTTPRFFVGADFVAVQVNGRILVWGGRQVQPHPTDNSPDNSPDNLRFLPADVVFVLEVAPSLWRRIPATGDVPPGTKDAAAVVLDETVYIFGGGVDCGGGEIRRTNAIFSLSFDGEFQRLLASGDVPTPREALRGWAFEGDLYFFGGEGERGIGGGWVANASDPNTFYNDQLIQFDAALNVFSLVRTTGRPPFPRSGYAAATSGETVYVHGGSCGEEAWQDFHALNMKSLAWSSLNWGPSIAARGHQMSPISETQMIVVGGDSGGREKDERLSNEALFVVDVDEESFERLDVEFGADNGGAVGVTGHRVVAVTNEQRIACVFSIGGFVDKDSTQHPNQIVRFTW